LEERTKWGPDNEASSVGLGKCQPTLKTDGRGKQKATT